MKKILCFLIMIFFLGGCAFYTARGSGTFKRISNKCNTVEECRQWYYTSPLGDGYEKPSIRLYCSHCGEEFKISQHDFDNHDLVDDNVITCPVCNHEEKADLVKKFSEEESARKEQERLAINAKKRQEKERLARERKKEKIRNQEHGLVCIQCGRHFFLKGWQLGLSETTICPYCEKEQNMQPALNRYTYDTQQQKQYQQQQVYQQQQSNQEQANQQREQEYQQLLQAYQQRVNALKLQQTISNLFQIQAEHGQRKKEIYMEHYRYLRDRPRRTLYTPPPPGSSKVNPIYVSPGY